MNFDKGFENVAYNCNCLELLQEMKHKNIIADWLITDPPYGVDRANDAHKKSGQIYSSKLDGNSKGTAKAAKKVYEDTGEWDKERLTKEYFDLMLSVCRNWIIFGGNYYTDYTEYLPPTKSWIVWDKRCGITRNCFPDGEMAYCSTDVLRIFPYYYNGFAQADMKHKDERFHPTQKPTQLMVDLLNFYTKPNDLILDPFLGSFTTAVACYRTGRRFIGAEISKTYFDKGYKRYIDESAQISIFDIKNE